MSTENPVAERLLEDARKKTARTQSPSRGRTALIVGVIALVVSPISLLGWIGGVTALGLGAGAVRRPACARQARIAMALGGAAILVGVFFYSLDVALS